MKTEVEILRIQLHALEKENVGLKETRGRAWKEIDYLRDRLHVLEGQPAQPDAETHWRLLRDSWFSEHFEHMDDPVSFLRIAGSWLKNHAFGLIDRNLTIEAVAIDNFKPVNLDTHITGQKVTEFALDPADADNITESLEEVLETGNPRVTVRRFKLPAEGGGFAVFTAMVLIARCPEKRLWWVIYVPENTVKLVDE